AQSASQLFGHAALQLNGQVANAAARVEHSRLGEGLRGAGLQAGRAGAAVAACVRRVRFQFNIEQQGPEKEETSYSLVQKHRILAEPAEASAAREVAFEQRRRVDDATTAAIGNL